MGRRRHIDVRCSTAWAHCFSSDICPEPLSVTPQPRAGADAAPAQSVRAAIERCPSLRVNTTKVCERDFSSTGRIRTIRWRANSSATLASRIDQESEGRTCRRSQDGVFGHREHRPRPVNALNWGRRQPISRPLFLQKSHLKVCAGFLSIDSSGQPLHRHDGAACIHSFVAA